MRPIPTANLRLDRQITMPNPSTHLKKGLFIVFEGVDGSGKTTQIQRLKEYLKGDGYDTATTREPTNSIYGQKIRQIAEKGRDGITAEDEVELFVLDREIDVRENIQPVLARHGIVISDRYYYSNLVYQGALGATAEYILEKNSRFPKPDCVLLFDLDPKESLKRINQNREGANVGYEKLEFLQEVRARYQAIKAPEIVRVDASQTPDRVFDKILEAIQPLLQQEQSP